MIRPCCSTRSESEFGFYDEAQKLCIGYNREQYPFFMAQKAPISKRGGPGGGWGYLFIGEFLNV